MRNESKTIQLHQIEPGSLVGAEPKVRDPKLVKEVMRLNGEALERYRENDFEAARLRLEEVLLIDPEFAQPYHSLWVLYGKQEDHALAYLAAMEFLRLASPENPVAREMRKVFGPGLNSALEKIEKQKKLNRFKNLAALAAARMVEPKQLCEDVRAVFGSVKFPTHRGLRASMVLDPVVQSDLDLGTYTNKEDFHGEWWDVPDEELDECRLALSYLDPQGIEYYLPAYLTRALNDLQYRNYSQLLFCLTPKFTKDDDLRDWFEHRFSKITGAKKRVCVQFLELLRDLEPQRNDPFSVPDRIDRILKDRYWIGNGENNGNEGMPTVP